MKKKKVSRKNKPTKQKIDVVIESLVHLEQRVKELIEKVESLETQRYYHPYNAEPKKYCPNVPYRYDGVTWTY